MCVCDCEVLVKRGTLRWDEERLREQQAKASTWKTAPAIPSSVGAECAATKLTLILPFPPSGNTSVRHTSTGHYRTRVYNDYRAQVALIASQVRAEGFDGPVEVTALFWPPDRRQRDMDNNWKTLSDSLQAAGVFKNDAQICRLELLRMAPKERGEVCVTVKEAA